jgi:UDP-glucose:(heptosyl)LPS alpha-1,3-glucosyltransferase
MNEPSSPRCQRAVISIGLKIALVILHADPARGGAEQYTVDLAKALRRAGEDVSLLASSFPGDVIPANDVLLAARGATRAGRYVGFLDSLETHLKENHYDIVHAMLPVRRADVYHPHAGIAAEAVANGHLKHAAPLHRAIAKMSNRFNRRRQKFAAIERQLLSLASPPVVLCLSDYVKGFVRRHYVLPEQKLATLFNAVELNRFDPSSQPDAGTEIRARYSIKPDQVVGLMMAQDFERKGLREAIAAVARISDPRLVLLVAGKQHPTPYRALAMRAGVADRIIFAGSTSDPYAFYKAADLFVLPTRHDPCSLVVLEALAMGVPVISTVFNGACEIMKDGTHGFVLKDPADVESLAAAIRELLDVKRRYEMSKACLALRPALSYEHHLRDLMQVYHGVARM